MGGGGDIFSSFCRQVALVQLLLFYRHCSDPRQVAFIVFYRTVFRVVLYVQSSRHPLPITVVIIGTKRPFCGWIQAVPLSLSLPSIPQAACVYCTKYVHGTYFMYTEYWYIELLH